MKQLQILCLPAVAIFDATVPAKNFAAQSAAAAVLNDAGRGSIARSVNNSKV